MQVGLSPAVCLRCASLSCMGLATHGWAVYVTSLAALWTTLCQLCHACRLLFVHLPSALSIASSHLRPRCVSM